MASEVSCGAAIAGIRSRAAASSLRASEWAWRSACSCSRSVAISSLVRSWVQTWGCPGSGVGSVFNRTYKDAVLYDPYDPLIMEAFRVQPENLSPIGALRGAMREVLNSLPPEEMAELRGLITLIVSVPELRALARRADQDGQMVAELVAGRTGRPADDFAARTFAGAVVGVCWPGCSPWQRTRRWTSSR